MVARLAALAFPFLKHSQRKRFKKCPDCAGRACYGGAGKFAAELRSFSKALWAVRLKKSPVNRAKHNHKEEASCLLQRFAVEVMLGIPNKSVKYNVK
jgi:hypothetical protein